MRSPTTTAGILAVIILVAGPMLLAVPQSSMAQETADALKEQLVGSWRLVSYRAQREGEQNWREPLGPEPRGYAILTREGRYMHIITASGRKPPSNDAERAALLNSMTAWSGRYTVVDNGRFVAVVDTSWSEAHEGERQKQVRLVKIEGNTMTLRTVPQVGARGTTAGTSRGKAVTEFVFEREK